MKQRKWFLLLIPFLLIAMCCTGIFLWALVDTSLRQVGLLPTLTPTITSTATPIPTDTATPTVTLTPGPTDTLTAPPPPTNAVAPTLTPIPTATPIPTDTPLPAATPVPTGTPLPTATPIPTKAPKTKPDILAEVNGSGETVTDNYQLPACQKAVFYWEVGANPGQTAALIVHLHKAGNEQYVSLVNALEMDVPDKLSGSMLQALAGGKYYFTTENTNEAWSLRIECQDGMAPTAAGLDLQGDGDTVSANYALPACQKSIFNWSVAPNSGGTASLIVHLYSATDDGSAYLVNALEMDRTSPLEGKALQKIPGGFYYVTIENQSGSWKIRWECQD